MKPLNAKPMDEMIEPSCDIPSLLKNIYIKTPAKNTWRINCISSTLKISLPPLIKSASNQLNG